MVAPNRQRLLQAAALAAATGLSGCVGSPAAEIGNASTGDGEIRTPKDSTDRPPRRTPVDGIPRTVKLLSVDDAAVRREFGVDASVRVVKERVTGDHTAVIALSFENVGDEPVEVFHREDSCRGYETGARRESGGSRDSILYASTARAEKSDRCWVIPESRCGAGLIWHSLALDPGERETFDLDLGENEDNARFRRACMQPERYRFGFAFAASDEPESGTEGHFTLRVTADD